jgi:hypothetical protein
MSDEKAAVWTINDVTVKNEAGKAIMLEGFLTAKLGVSAGKRLYKELVTAVTAAVQSPGGFAAVDLSVKNGQFISLHEVH